ncbi:hypothetical protein ILP97_09740 [Amycolatopsis sp. H6(2020)]|nr:hypothetical protein [Amycolatopsis sp. H6(2020)]
MQAVNWEEVRNRTIALYARTPGMGRQGVPAVLSEKQVRQAEAQFGPFPDHDSALAASEDAWANRPQREDYVSDEAYQTADGAWYTKTDALEVARATGAIFLNDDGCGW